MYVSSYAEQPSGHFVLEEGSSAAAAIPILRSQSIDQSKLAPTPSEEELMANLEWDEEDLVEYPEIEEEGGIAVVAMNALEMDLEAELSSTLCNTSEEQENMILSRSFTASPNTERCVNSNCQFAYYFAERCLFVFQFAINVLKPAVLLLLPSQT